MKLKVMIVDDEQISVKYLRDLINWSAYGLELIPPAYNGKMAIDLYNEYHPDIIITDITMPVMNGLELARVIRELSSITYIVFLTAYDEFNYAKEAIKIGASDYILKHELTQQYLLEKMILIKTEFEKRWDHVNSIFEYEVSFLFNDENNTHNNDGIDNRVKELLSYSYFAAIIEEKMPLKCIISEFNYTQKESIDFNELKIIISNTEKKNEHINISKIGDNRFLLLYRDNENKNMVAKHQNFRIKISEIETNIRLNITKPVSLFCFIGEYTLDIFAKKYRKEMGNISYQYFDSGKTIFNIEDCQCLNGEDSKIDLSVFKESIEELDYQKAEKAINNISSNAFKNKDYVFLNNLISEAIHILKENFCNLTVIENGYSTIFVEPGCDKKWYSYRDAINWLCEITFKLIGIANKSLKKNYSSGVFNAINYIRQNYSREDLDVDLISESTHISKSYLSSQFKKEVGKTIIEYLTDYRIMIAKKLINEEYKIYEISEMVGFSSSQYFCKVFKQIEGISPGSYKNEKK